MDASSRRIATGACDGSLGDGARMNEVFAATLAAAPLCAWAADAAQAVGAWLAR